MMHKELKGLIIQWLLDNENAWQRVNECTKHFKEYIYSSDGEFLIGGKTVHNFIVTADNLLYGKEF